MAEIFGRTLGLVFEEGKGPLETGPTFAQIYLQSCIISERQGYPEPLRILTPVSMDPTEFDAWADHLIENIQALKKEARTEFDKASARRRESRNASKK